MWMNLPQRKRNGSGVIKEMFTWWIEFEEQREDGTFGTSVTAATFSVTETNLLVFNDDAGQVGAVFKNWAWFTKTGGEDTRTQQEVEPLPKTANGADGLVVASAV